MILQVPIASLFILILLPCWERTSHIPYHRKPGMFESMDFPFRTSRGFGGICTRSFPFGGYFFIWAIGKTPNTKCDLGFEVIVFGNALYRFTVFAASTKNIIFQNACGKPFQSSNSARQKAKSSRPHLPLHGHIFLHGTSSPSWAQLPLHGHIFPFMGASTSSWPPLPLHGRIFPFVGTSITGRHFVQKWLSLGYRFGYRSKPETFQEKWWKMNFMTSPPARSTGHLITFSCLAFGTESI